MPSLNTSRKHTAPGRKLRAGTVQSLANQVNRSSWRRAAKAHLAKSPLCVQCEKEGRLRPATEVDHVTARRDGGDVYDESNMQSLCKSCHSKKTYRETLGVNGNGE